MPRPLNMTLPDRSVLGNGFGGLGSLVVSSISVDPYAWDRMFSDLAPDDPILQNIDEGVTYGDTPGSRNVPVSFRTRLANIGTPGGVNRFLGEYGLWIVGGLALLMVMKRSR